VNFATNDSFQVKFAVLDKEKPKLVKMWKFGDFEEEELVIKKAELELKVLDGSVGPLADETPEEEEVWDDGLSDNASFVIPVAIVTPHSSLQFLIEEHVFPSISHRLPIVPLNFLSIATLQRLIDEPVLPSIGDQLPLFPLNLRSIVPASLPVLTDWSFFRFLF
jgi:hypothetical protein